MEEHKEKILPSPVFSEIASVPASEEWWLGMT
jgi:hypothetical protein